MQTLLHVQLLLDSEIIKMHKRVQVNYFKSVK